MTRLCMRVCIWGAAALLFGGCQVEKSSNPLSPAIAGPLEGVVISTPQPLEPGQDWELRTRDQPVQLLIQNAATNGERPLKYSLDIAADANFTNIVFARTGIEPGADGQTRLQLPDKLAAGTYYWRTRAEDGANASAYSDVKTFRVLAQVVLAPPAPSAPSNGSTISGLIPQFKIKATARSGVTEPIEYILQVSNNSSFTSIAANFNRTETWPETTIAPGYSFLYSRTYYWRVRAWHTGDGSDLSNWSAVQTFKTPDPPVVAPPPGPAPSPNPGTGGGSNPGSCNSRDGSDIAECIEARFPQYLVANISLSRRVANMQFLRDRLIEHAKCKGLNVGLNLKRGGPSISNDFITYHTGGRWVGVDIASGYDDTSDRLNLMWYQHGGSTNWGHPYYKDYGSVNCN